MSEEIEACPECDSAMIANLVGSDIHSEAADHEHYCRACGAKFDEPTLRERKGPGGRGYLAGDLEDADPDDLVTDGGFRGIRGHNATADYRQKYKKESWKRTVLIAWIAGVVVGVIWEAIRR